MGFSSGLAFFVFLMCGYCGLILMVLRGPSDLHRVHPAIHRWAYFSSQTWTVYPSRFVPKPSLCCIRLNCQCLLFQEGITITEPHKRHCFSKLDKSATVFIVLTTKTSPSRWDAAETIPRLWRQLQVENLGGIHTLSWHGVVGCMQVSNSALVHEVCTLKCISSD